MDELKLFLLELVKIGRRLNSEQLKKPPDKYIKPSKRGVDYK